MIFSEKSAKSPSLGSTRFRSSCCIVPLVFNKITYWLHLVVIEETYTKDAITIFVDGGGYSKDGWKITEVYV